MQPFRKFCGICDEDEINVWHAEVGFQQRVCDESQEFVGKVLKPRASDAAQQQSCFPSELDKDADREDPKQRDMQRFILLGEVPHDGSAVADK